MTSSISHHNFSSGNNSTIGDGGSIIAKSQDTEDFQKFHIKNMYNVEKFVNPHDIAGTKGIVEAQKDELENKKVQFRVSNELYLRKHPEISKLTTVFLLKVLDDKPKNILPYAGKFFDNPKLEEIVDLEYKHYTEKK